MSMSAEGMRTRYFVHEDEGTFECVVHFFVGGIDDAFRANLFPSKFQIGGPKFVTRATSERSVERSGGDIDWRYLPGNSRRARS